MICTRCEIDRPTTRFNKRKDGESITGYRMPCKNCINKGLRTDAKRADRMRYYRNYAAKKPKEVSASRHATWLKIMYNVTPEWYAAQCVRQNNACAACHNPCPYGRLSVDHDHVCCPGPKSCGRCVQELLCRDCNQGLSKFHDDPIRLQAAADYVTRLRGQRGLAELWEYDYECPCCGYTVRTTHKWIAVGAPRCPSGTEMVPEL
jgi:hypothetical protein